MKEKMNEFIDICKKSQMTLKLFLKKRLSDYYDNVVSENGFLYAKGDVPILLTAHMDTVHKENVQKVVVNDDIITSPQGIGGDDRCGVYIILKILEKGYRPSILFCEDEEVGGIGSNKFIKTKYMKELCDLKFFVELDRANANDAVFYDCGNEEFQQFIESTTGYKTAFGSFSDISHLSPVTDVASVNLSCGYYKAHTTGEYVVFSEMENTIEIVEKLCGLNYADVKKYDYQKVSYNYYGYGNYYNRYLRDDDITYLIIYQEYDSDNDRWDEKYSTVTGRSFRECLGIFFLDHKNICFEDVLDYYEIYGGNRMTRLTKEMRDIVPILKRNGYVPVRSKGSHFIFKNRTTHRTMTISKNLKWMIWEEIVKDYNLEA